jgi:glutaminyl-tRNA synthetase
MILDGAQRVIVVPGYGLAVAQAQHTVRELASLLEAQGTVVELRCSYDPESRGGGTKDGRKVLGTSHWVSAAHAVDAEVRLYEKLLSIPDPAAEKEEKDFKEYLNPASLEILKGCKVEPGLAPARPGQSFQFLRQGYFCVDADSTPERPVFNRSVTLRDSWAKIEKSQGDK